MYFGSPKSGTIPAWYNRKTPAVEQVDSTPIFVFVNNEADA